ncbi:MAG: hypothetical protein FJZ59_05460 [Chlamydiae bacterium]|jgi:hypothetical protein|nr:hypothetical protein [Chlamydiota bacterium]
MEIPLLDEIDLEILMHRNAHFGGNFTIMIEYYENEGVGSMPDFDIDRIAELQEIQEELGEDLAAKLLPMPAFEEVARSRELYQKLEEVYDNPKAIIPILLSDLILTEDEEPVTEIKAIIDEGEKMVDPLLHIIDSTDFFNPLFPGYGRTPAFAAVCLDKIGNPKAIPHLFGALGGENLDLEEIFISSLVSFGKPAKTFLLKRLLSKPFSKDNLNAAMALAFFPLDEEIAKTALELLKDESHLLNESFAPYLICLTEGLQSEADRDLFKEITKKTSFPKELKLDGDTIIHSWQSA